MNKLILIISFLLLSGIISSQNNISVGADLSVPIEANLVIGFGFSGVFEYSLNEKSSITAMVGFKKFIVTSKYDWDNKSSSIIPILFGYRYYSETKDDGVFLDLQLGVNKFNYAYSYVQNPGYNKYFDLTSTKFGLGVGVGYVFSTHFDLGFHYNYGLVEGIDGSIHYFDIGFKYRFLLE